MRTKINFLVFLSVIQLSVLSCAKKDSTSKSSTANTDPNIKVVNISDVSTSKITNWSTNAAAKMKSQTANILSVSWNIGEFVSEGGFNRPFNTHKVIISSTQIETLMSEINSWLDTTCADTETKNDESKNFRNYISNGADASVQLSICKQYRIILMGIITGNKEADTQHLVIHEFYHAFQQDLGDDDCNQKRDISGSNGKGWMIEGTADYFTLMEMHGSTTGVQKILKSGLEAYQEDNSTDITGSGVASRGAAGIRYMVEKGTLTEGDILDGSFFHNCITESDYTDSNADVLSAESNWYKIILSDGTYSFQ